jgi:hypothetical protein
VAYVEVLASVHGEGTWMNRDPDALGPFWRVRHPGRVVEADIGELSPGPDAADWDRVEDRQAVHMINELEDRRRTREHLARFAAPVR